MIALRPCCPDLFLCCFRTISLQSRPVLMQQMSTCGCSSDMHQALQIQAACSACRQSKLQALHKVHMPIQSVQERSTRVWHGMAWHSAAQHSTAQHSTAQHSTAQHSTAQHSTAQHSTAQHSIVQIGKGVALQDGGEDKVMKSVGSQVEQGRHCFTKLCICLAAMLNVLALLLQCWCFEPNRGSSCHSQGPNSPLCPSSKQGLCSANPEVARKFLPAGTPEGVTIGVAGQCALMISAEPHLCNKEQLCKMDGN